MSTIRETALAAAGGRVPRGMGRQAQAAVDALEAREQAMFEEIVEAGVSLGATRAQVRDILVTVGLSAPAEDVAVDEEIPAWGQALIAKVDGAIAEGRRRLARR